MTLTAGVPENPLPPSITVVYKDSGAPVPAHILAGKPRQDRASVAASLPTPQHHEYPNERSTR